MVVNPNYQVDGIMRPSPVQNWWYTVFRSNRARGNQWSIPNSPLPVVSWRESRAVSIRGSPMAWQISGNPEPDPWRNPEPDPWRDPEPDP